MQTTQWLTLMAIIIKVIKSYIGWRNGVLLVFFMSFRDQKVGRRSCSATWEAKLLSTGVRQSTTPTQSYLIDQQTKLPGNPSQCFKLLIYVHQSFNWKLTDMKWYCRSSYRIKRHNVAISQVEEYTYVDNCLHFTHRLKVKGKIDQIYEFPFQPVFGSCQLWSYKGMKF